MRGSTAAHPSGMKATHQAERQLRAGPTVAATTRLGVEGEGESEGNGNDDGAVGWKEEGCGQGQDRGNPELDLADELHRKRMSRGWGADRPFCALSWTARWRSKRCFADDHEIEGSAQLSLIRWRWVLQWSGNDPRRDDRDPPRRRRGRARSVLRGSLARRARDRSGSSLAVAHGLGPAVGHDGPTGGVRARRFSTRDCAAPRLGVYPVTART